MACRLQDEDPAFRINVDCYWPSEAPLGLQIHSPACLEDVRIRLNIGLRPGRNLLRVAYQRGDKAPVQAKDLQPMGIPVSHVDISIRVYRYTGGTVNLAHTPRGAAKGGQERSGGREFLYPAVLPIGNIHVTLSVQADPPGHIELALTLAVLAPHGQELPVFGELLDTAVETVDDVKVLIAVKGQARWTAQFALAAASFAPLGQELAVLIKDRNPLQVFVSDIQVLVAVQVNRRRPDKLPIPSAEAAKLTEELMARGTFADALAEFFTTAVDDIQDAVGTQGKIDRVPEPQARHAIHPNAITMVEDPPGRTCRQHGSLLNAVVSG